MSLRSDAQHGGGCRWLLSQARSGPLDLWRALAGLWLLAYLAALAGYAHDLVGAGALFERGLIARVLPETRASVLRLPLLEQQPWIAWLCSGLAALGISLGWRTRLCASIVYAVVLSCSRALYPLSGPLESVGVHLTLWLMLVPAAGRFAVETQRGRPRSRPPKALILCATVTTLLLLSRIDLVDRDAAVAVATYVLTLACMLSALVPRGPRTVAPQGPAFVAGLSIAGLCVAQPVAASADAAGAAVALTAVLDDLGLCTRVTTVPATSLAPSARLRSGEAALPAAHIWPELLRRERVWWYLWQPSAPRGERPLQRLQLLGSLRQALADRACAKRSYQAAEVTAMVEQREVVLFAFRCQRSKGRLFPASVLAVSPTSPGLADAYARKRRFEAKSTVELPSEHEIAAYLADTFHTATRPPVSEILRVAHLRYALREFDEALELVSTATRLASPDVRRKAKLESLRRLIEATGDE